MTHSEILLLFGACGSGELYPQGGGAFPGGAPSPRPAPSVASSTPFPDAFLSPSWPEAHGDRAPSALRRSGSRSLPLALPEASFLPARA